MAVKPMESQRDLVITVGVPEKHVTTMETYIGFKITTKTSRGGEFKAEEYEVRRRYSDFSWIRQKLQDAHPTHLIPPLPEKHSLTRLDRFEADFLLHRQQALQIFLDRVVAHPVLSFNPDLLLFLTAKPWEMQAAKKEGPGFISRVNDSFQNKTAPLVLGSRGRRDPDIDAIFDFISHLRENLTSVEKVAAKIAIGMNGHEEGLRELAPLVREMAASEDKETLGKPLKSLAASIQCESDCIAELVKETKEQTDLGLHEYSLYTACIQDVLNRRDAIQLEFENARQELRKKKEELDSLGVYVDAHSPSSLSPSPSNPSSQTSFVGPGFFDSLLGKDAASTRRDRVRRLSVQVAESTTLLNSRADRAACADADLKADMERWQADRVDDFVGIGARVAAKQVEYHRKCLSSWETTRDSFNALEIGKGESIILNSRNSSHSSTKNRPILSSTEEGFFPDSDISNC